MNGSVRAALLVPGPDPPARRDVVPAPLQPHKHCQKGILHNIEKKELFKSDWHLCHKYSKDFTSFNRIFLIYKIYTICFVFTYPRMKGEF